MYTIALLLNGPTSYATVIAAGNIPSGVGGSKYQLFEGEQQGPFGPCVIARDSFAFLSIDSWGQKWRWK